MPVLDDSTEKRLSCCHENLAKLTERSAAEVRLSSFNVEVYS